MKLIEKLLGSSILILLAAITMVVIIFYHQSVTMLHDQSVPGGSDSMQDSR